MESSHPSTLVQIALAPKTPCIFLNIQNIFLEIFVANQHKTMTLVD